jgi:hypothetical protein
MRVLSTSRGKQAVTEITEARLEARKRTLLDTYLAGGPEVPPPPAEVSMPFPCCDYVVAAITNSMNILFTYLLRKLTANSFITHPSVFT